jgi:CubicO group peptidase (beta-lactamase class C family)
MALACRQSLAGVWTLLASAIPTPESLITRTGESFQLSEAQSLRWCCRRTRYGLILLATFHALCWLMSAAETREVWPRLSWPIASPAELNMDASQLDRARDYALTGSGSGQIIRFGRLVVAWGDPQQLYDLKSTTKSFGSAALGLAMLDRRVSLTEPAWTYLPDFGATNARPDWLRKITILHLASQTAGFEKPGGFGALLFEPGTEWHYSDGGPNWLADILTVVYQRDLDDLMFERVFQPIGITRADLKWRFNSYRPKTINGINRREFGSGISANV